MINLNETAFAALKLLCCLSTFALSSCVSTDELYAQYDALNCKFVVEQEAGGTQVIRELYSDTVHQWQPIVFFEYDKASLTPEAETRLKSALLVLGEVPGANLALQGFADHYGTVDYNRALAGRRVDQVRRWLITNGVDAKRISLRAVGEGLQPFGQDDEQSRARNRRVELLLLDNQGLPLLQMSGLQDQ